MTALLPRRARHGWRALLRERAWRLALSCRDPGAALCSPRRLPQLSVSAGWKKSGFQQYLGAAIRHCSSCSSSGSDATILQRVEPSDAANAVAQPANKIEACPAAGDFQAYGKSRLPGQMSRRVEKPPARGRFGIVLVSYSPLASVRGALLFAHLGA